MPDQRTETAIRPYNLVLPMHRSSVLSCSRWLSKTPFAWKDEG